LPYILEVFLLRHRDIHIVLVLILLPMGVTHQ
jgi:hypothetical protein